MILVERVRCLCFLFLAMWPFGFAIGSELKTEIAPEVLDLNIALDVGSRGSLVEVLTKNGFDHLGVDVVESGHEGNAGNGARFQSVHVSLPRDCSFLETLTDDDSDLSNSAQIPDQITWNDVFAGLFYCSRHSEIKQGSLDFEQDFVSQEAFHNLPLSKLGLVDQNESEKCRLSNGSYSYDSDNGGVDCLARASWYTVEVYDHVYRDMNHDGYLDLVLFVVVDGAWSGPPDRLVTVLTRTRRGGAWQAVENLSTGVRGEDNLQSGGFESKEIDDFPHLEDFGGLAEFQDYIDDYARSCIDNTDVNTRTIPCFVSYELWDRELNKYYQQLRELLTKEERASLLESQRLWIKSRDRTVELNSSLLDWRYEGMRGTMFNAMRSGDADEAIAPMVRQRAMFLKRWVDLKKYGQVRSNW